MKKLGFIGLGVMGEPICANITKGGFGPMTVMDLNPDPVARLADIGAEVATDFASLCAAADIIFLSLPGGPEVEKVMLGEDGLLAHGTPGQIIVDLSTCPVILTREIFEAAKAKDIAFADAPVARTRQAAIDGTLSIMVGGSPELFAKIRPYLAAAAEEITHCGDIGTGQVVKLMNNMVLFQTVVALSEAFVTAERAGVSRDKLVDILSLGSADSFALRNHGRKAMVPNKFPLQAFGTDYAHKDITYALALAKDMGVETPSAELAKGMLERSSAAGFGAEYFPALINMVSGTSHADYLAQLDNEDE
ncbi:MAG: 2-hydroxy-3-oxopropionate reductase [Sneathiella sp.]|nr:MAG: 2-hydroxy-3-oxopropionate reductase [Sneathiella sp.]